MNNTSKITLQELQQIFEDGKVPMAAFSLLAEPGNRTADEVRALLREIRAQWEPRYLAKRALVSAVISWREAYDLKHSEACELAEEVFLDFGRHQTTNVR